MESETWPRGVASIPKVDMQARKYVYRLMISDSEPILGKRKMETKKAFDLFRGWEDRIETTKDGQYRHIWTADSI